MRMQIAIEQEVWLWIFLLAYGFFSYPIYGVPAFLLRHAAASAKVRIPQTLIPLLGFLLSISLFTASYLLLGQVLPCFPNCSIPRQGTSILAISLWLLDWIDRQSAIALLQSRFKVTLQVVSLGLPISLLLLPGDIVALSIGAFLWRISQRHLAALLGKVNRRVSSRSRVSSEEM